MNCEKCGKPIADNAPFCEHCGTTQTRTASASVPAQKPENVITGCVGALIGAAIGGGSIILLGQLGYVAAISGLILAICTLKGYELLGGKLSTKGIIISLVLMLAAPYIADRMNWAIVVAEAFADSGVTFGTAFAAIPELVEEGVIEKADYIKDLVMIYAFVVLGAFSTIRGAFKRK